MTKVTLKTKRNTWYSRIQAAIKAGGANKQMELDALSWPTCACGAGDKRVPRYKKGELGFDGLEIDSFESGMPKDETLSDLGADFYDQIVTGLNGDTSTQRVAALRKAIQTMRAIDKREVEVIREEIAAGRVKA